MIIDGKKIADDIQAELKNQIALFKGRKPALAVILVGDHPASQIYVARKAESCESVGIRSVKLILPSSISERKLLDEVEKLNRDESIDGILVQLPLPPHINPAVITRAVLPEKDVDGFHPTNVGKMLIGDKDGFIPCTPLGIKELLERSGIEVSGKHAVVLGRSNIVGKPIAALLMQSMPGGNATVTVLHSKSKNIEEICRMADILIAAIGKPKFVTSDFVKEGAVVIDVGINKIENPTKKSGFELIGDVDFESVKGLCSFITPVPKGVGPMTIAMLLKNTVQAYVAYRT